MKELISYYIMINILGLLIMKTDKQRAQKGKWRIPERYLWLISLLGGSLGTLLGMYHYRHKTKHIQFRIGIPIILVIQVIGWFIFY
ncbi:DUF1294 domain-containing protein [Amphibacillus sp. MSJ-3]|nr:DUF1294 domain-containing protein [Amphibacillus sp. MSJ-3]MBU5593640.1 DUF1294 domain-containing protein [Amphibacillus sp. MSJ-3]